MMNANITAMEYVGGAMKTAMAMRDHVEANGFDGAKFVNTGMQFLAEMMRGGETQITAIEHRIGHEFNSGVAHALAHLTGQDRGR